jgi:hypothetical protein
VLGVHDVQVAPDPSRARSVLGMHVLGVHDVHVVLGLTLL